MKTNLILKDAIATALFPLPEAEVVQLVPETRSRALSFERITVKTERFTLSVEDFFLVEGSRSAIVGPNGAGKTTLVEAILGLRDAEIVNGSILGVTVQKWAKTASARRTLGVQLQKVDFHSNLDVSDIVGLHRVAYGQVDAAVADALEIAELAPLRYRTLSRGQKQRLDLYLALAHRPRLIILDEPLAGLDRHFYEAVRGLLRSDKTTTLLMICHTAEELMLVDEVIWVHGGRIRERGLVDVLRQKFTGSYRCRLVAPDLASAEAWREKISRLEDVRMTSSYDVLDVCATGGEQLAELVRGIVANHLVSAYELMPCGLNELLDYCAKVECRS